MRFSIIVALLTAAAAAASPPSNQRQWSTAQLWGHFSQHPGNIIEEKRLTQSEASAIQQNGNIKQTEEFYPKREPTDAGSVYFYYDAAEGRYWMRRINKMNPSNPDWMAGPFALP